MLQFAPPQTALIVGATSDIGTTLSRTLHEAGTKLVLAGRDKDALETLGSQLGHPVVEIDAESPESLEAAVRHSHELIGDLSGIANCIGSVLLKPAHLTSFEEWNRCLTLNLTSCFSLLKAAGNLQSHPLSLVFVSSAAATIGLANHEAIAAAKSGIEGLVRSASATYAGKGIRVNAVAPGLVETKLTEKITARESSRNFSLGMHPVGRLGNEQDIASAIAWFLSPQQDWVTGQTLGVDGGLSSLKVR